MNDVDLLRIVETLNLELIHLKGSKEYSLGKKIVRFINEVKQFRFMLQLKRAIKNRKLKKVRETFVQENVDADSWKQQIRFGDASKKFLIYSCITGGYDLPSDPLFHLESVDHIMFTDAESVKGNVWKKAKIPQNLKNFSLSDQNRYVKMHPFELFPDADYACYIDGNVCPVSDLSIYAELIDPSVGFVMHNHSTRNCIYEELKACLAMHKGRSDKLKQQLNQYAVEGFPKEYGMLECNVFIVDLHNENAKRIFADWWDELMNSQSARDQMALPYVLWKNGVSVESVAKMGCSVYKNPKVIIKEHL